MNALIHACMYACMYVCTYVCMYLCMYACMYVCTYVCMYLCMYACMYVCTYVCMYLCMYACIYVCTYVCMYLCMYACIYVCMYLCMYACIYVCMYACMYVCMYVQPQLLCYLLILFPLDNSDIYERVKRTGLYYRHYSGRRRGRSCGDPGTIKHGYSWYHSRHTGSVVVHSCKSGYALVGAKIRTCQSNGKWKPKLPECVCKCTSVLVQLKYKCTVLVAIVTAVRTFMVVILNSPCYEFYAMAFTNTELM